MLITEAPEDDTTRDETPTVSPSGTPPPAGGGRIAGIDIARGLALLGMFVVHVGIVGPDGEKPGALASGVLAAPAGQASVLFFILSGVALSIVAGRGSASADPGTLRRRGAVLLGGGLLLSATVWAASILEHYGVMFLLAPWLIRRSDRTLSVVAATGLLAGPAALLAGAGRVDPVYGLGEGVVGWLATTATGLAFDGIYPLVVWTGIFVLGVRLGRFDLLSRVTAIRLVIAGVAIAAVTFATVAVFAAAGVEPELAEFDWAAVETEFDELSDGEIVDGELDEGVFFEKGDGEFFDEELSRHPRELLDTSPHSGRIGWAVRSAAIAVAIMGAALLLPAATQRALRPLAALGSISLTAYLLHIALVTDGWSLLVGDEPTIDVTAQLAVLAGLQALLVGVAAVIVARWRTGPAERGLKALTAGRPPASRR